MLVLPKSVETERNKAAESKLVEKTIAWLTKEGAGRDPRIHASDLLDPLKAYWNRKHKETFTAKMAGNFMVGKVLHAFFITAMRDGKGTDLTDTDVGGTWDDSLGISFSNDFEDKTGLIPGELKTSRAMQEQAKSSLTSYLRQLCIYMAAKKSLKGRLVVLMLNGKDYEKGWGTYPSYRAYEVEWSKADMLKYRKQIKDVAALLAKAIKAGKPTGLALCQDWKCGKSNCGHYSLCKPKGRYGTKRFDK